MLEQPPPPGFELSPEEQAAKEQADIEAAAAATTYSFDAYGQPYPVDGQYIDSCQFMTPEEYAAFMREVSLCCVRHLFALCGTVRLRMLVHVDSCQFMLSMLRLWGRR